MYIYIYTVVYTFYRHDQVLKEYKNLSNKLCGFLPKRNTYTHCIFVFCSYIYIYIERERERERERIYITDYFSNSHRINY